MSLKTHLQSEGGAMTVQITVPPLGESVTEATVSRWLKNAGDTIQRDEPLVELETDKVTLEVNAPSAGTLTEIRVSAGGVVGIGDILGVIGEVSAANASEPSNFSLSSQQTDAAHQESPQVAPEQVPPIQIPSPPFKEFLQQPTAPSEPAQPTTLPSGSQETCTESSGDPLSPAVRKMVAEQNLDPQGIPASGKDGRVTKGDVLSHLAGNGQRSEPDPQPSQGGTVAPLRGGRGMTLTQPEERVKMSRLRQRIAERLKEAQNTAALLTSFNEIDMTNVMSAREKYRQQFEKKFGSRLGFMSFFVKAAIAALKEIPVVNAEVDGEYIVYKNHYDIGVAVSVPQGLVVPVVRDADHLTFAEIELKIQELSEKARNGKLGIEDLTGGTFTITNGGVFGSLMSTPIINPPQSAILGMHKIEKRPVAVEDKIEIRPMMYVALTYDHRIIDGREAVTFLVRVKEYIEDPWRLLLDV